MRRKKKDLSPTITEERAIEIADEVYRIVYTEGKKCLDDYPELKNSTDRAMVIQYFFDDTIDLEEILEDAEFDKWEADDEGYSIPEWLMYAEEEGDVQYFPWKHTIERD